MKTFKQLTDGILDDLIGEFPNPKPQKKYKTVTRKPAKRFAPRVFKGKKGLGFETWARGMAHLQELLGTKKITLKAIIDGFANKNIAVADSFTVDISVLELNSIREYNREVTSGFSGKNTKEEVDALEASIKKSGIKNYGIVNIKRKSNGDVTAILGEGNHRLSIAKKLKLKTMPIRFYYG